VNTVYIGIDPGLTGGIALLPGSDTRLGAWSYPMPVHQVSPKGYVKNAVNGAALTVLLRNHLSGMGLQPVTALAFVERVSAFPGQGVASMFSLGWSLGAVLGVLNGLGVPTVMVEPKNWKAHFKLTKEKEQARLLAARLFPDLTLTRKADHGRAEALLIGLYGRHLDKGITV